jgi:hypothetical protein
VFLQWSRELPTGRLGQRSKEGGECPQEPTAEWTCPLGTIAAGTLVTCAEPMRDVFGRVDRVKITIEGNEYITGYWVLETVQDSVGPRPVA